MSTRLKIKNTTIIPLIYGLLLFVIGAIIAYYSYSLDGAPRAFTPMGLFVTFTGILIIFCMER
ncbi:hypothetical protein JW865_09040 [Candidatus Bathyarchaeota archaeon]|nr:hypothetical protein [Candidatus Bathyarchaeota archaeon]